MKYKELLIGKIEYDYTINHLLVCEVFNDVLEINDNTSLSWDDKVPIELIKTLENSILEYNKQLEDEIKEDRTEILVNAICSNITDIDIIQVDYINSDIIEKLNSDNFSTMIDIIDNMVINYECNYKISFIIPKSIIEIEIQIENNLAYIFMN